MVKINFSVCQVTQVEKRVGDLRRRTDFINLEKITAKFLPICSMLHSTMLFNRRYNILTVGFNVMCYSFMKSTMKGVQVIKKFCAIFLMVVDGLLRGRLFSYTWHLQIQQVNLLLFIISFFYIFFVLLLTVTTVYLKHIFQLVL